MLSRSMIATFCRVSLAGLALLMVSTGSRRLGQTTSDKLAGIQVPDGYTVEVAAGPDLVDYPMFSTLDETGRLFVFESVGHVYKKTKDALDNPQFRIRLLEDINGDGRYDKSTIYADKVGFPQGGVFYKGSLYATSAPDLLKFTDTNGDGVADKREVILTGWTLNVNANSLVGPFMGPDGWFYMTSAIMGFNVMTQEGKRLKGGTARIWRVRPDGSGLEWIAAGGMNNPVELTFTEAAEPIGTETYFTEPQAGQRDALVYWTEGGVYPKPNNNIARDSLVRTGELMPVVSKYSRVAPSGIGRYRHTALGADFKDNLFSAQFNTHRVLRHKLIREGASFRTEDQVFFASKDEDFHPTDVLEGGDGSLLVVETGGWFIEGCPLSQVSKPELEGAIYRVRRTDALQETDPYGNQLAWTTMTAAKAATYLADPRPTVRDRAVERLVDLGSAAVPILANLLRRSSVADVRTKAVFALYRIGTPPALAALRTGLSDTTVPVRVAAARAVGLARDAGALAKLTTMVGRGDAAVRRQAATALGQLADGQTIPALIAATGTTDDRFVRHALIHALITLNQPKAVEVALKNSSPLVQEAALIALDQMSAAHLQAGQVTPFLTKADQRMQRTALWVATHHPAWAGEMASFLQGRFAGPPLTADEETLFGDMLVAFSSNAAMQRFMADQLATANTERKLLLLNTMARYPAEKLPASWVEQIGQQLVSVGDSRVKTRALELVGLRSLTVLSGQLTQVANDAATHAALRLTALGTLLKTSPAFTPAQFTYLYGQLTVGANAPLRQQAAAVLAQGKLTDDQLLTLAQDYLPKADAFSLPRLLPVFKGAHVAAIGTSLANTLAQSPGLDSFSEETLTAIFADYPADVKPDVAQLMTKLRDLQGGRRQRLQAMEGMIASGDLERGRALFYGKAICSTCHKIQGEGGKLGPDLTSIQRDRSSHDLLEAIVYPSVSFVREYETYRVSTKMGDHTGIIQEQTPTALVLGTSQTTSVRIPRADITSMTLQPTSMMPQGLDQLMTPQDMADLMAFLLGQDQDPTTDQAILR
ncbi:PVC-type heme-binding CxxCH protein [Fibrella aquatilis]|uniref:HEAT repeat domain-containing protein n=1 Tax=Fibrella aquatilis TaxID=2817059 RepID=A0A939K1T6_9BACT|nr:PVC-type heme-binding CxxCH protein [Fibrella aquatilis]MBO0933863.1 HEAT repeat domain-containing protein [Fibrella aquatilis]